MAEEMDREERTRLEIHWYEVAREGSRHLQGVLLAREREATSPEEKARWEEEGSAVAQRFLALDLHDMEGAQRLTKEFGDRIKQLKGWS